MRRTDGDSYRMTDPSDQPEVTEMENGVTVGLDLDGGVAGLAFSGVFDAGVVAVVDVLIEPLAGSSFHQVVVDVRAMSAVDGVSGFEPTGLRCFLEGRGAAVEVHGACPVVAQALRRGTTRGRGVAPAAAAPGGPPTARLGGAGLLSAARAGLDRRIVERAGLLPAAGR